MNRSCCGPELPARGLDESLNWLPVTSTADGDIVRYCRLTVSVFLRIVCVCGPVTDVVGSGYGLAQGCSSSTAPGRETGTSTGDGSLGVVPGLGSVTKTVGAGCSVISMLVDGCERGWLGDACGDVCVWTFFPGFDFFLLLRVTAISSSYGNTWPYLHQHAVVTLSATQ